MSDNAPSSVPLPKEASDDAKANGIYVDPSARGDGADAKPKGFSAKREGGALEFRFDSDAAALAVANRFKQVLNQSAYEAFIRSNPDAYEEGAWIVWSESKQWRHLPPKTADGTRTTLADALQGAPEGAFCTRFSKKTPEL